MALPLIMGVGELDPYCTKLMAVFTLERKAYRFNELKRHLANIGLKMTTPTLILHLDHLVKKELVLREEKGKQFVTYRFYWERWEDSDELMRRRIIFEKILQQEIDEFSSRPIIEQISYINNIAVLLFLMIIRESIVATAKPEKEFVANINMIHFGNIFNRARNMILNNVEKKGERYATQCLLTIDKLASLYVEAKHEIEGFQQMALPTIHITEKTDKLLEKIHLHLNEKKKPEDQVIKPDVIHLALKDYAKNLGVN